MSKNSTRKPLLDGFANLPQNRREMLQWCANGFGAIALQSLQSHNTARAVTPEQDSP